MPVDDLAAVDDAAIAATIDALIDARADGATICPSEVARALTSEGDAWRPAMPAVRRVAACLAHDGRIVVTRRGTVVDAESPGGPIRLGRPPRPV